jgi:protein-S-isoprenylcysteine O-methyltransferase Ste14
MWRLISAVYGSTAYVIFLGSFLYAVGFVGNLPLPKTIDSPPLDDLWSSLLVNVGLLGLFAIQHSVMARPGFKAIWTKVIPSSLERSTYVLISSLLLFLIFWQWRSIAIPIWDTQSDIFRTGMLVLYWVGWLVVLLSTFMISHWDLFGLRQVYLNLQGRAYERPEFKTRALYGFVRHPIMLGFIIAFWATPAMSLGHLVFAVATTGYILIALQFEERDLVAA